MDYYLPRSFVRHPIFPSAPMTQKVLQQLKAAGDRGLSAVEAADRIRCRALPRRIADLRELNWNIKREMRTDVTGQRYARYFLTS